jgi:hypothetical protein
MKNTQGARMTTNIKLPAYWAHTFAALLALTLLNDAHAENYVPYGYKFEPFDYQFKTTPKEGKATYLKDPNVWVYTSAFAKRFGMPDQWIDDSLQGAEAVAFRIESTNIETCGYFGEEENCRPSFHCFFDVYLTDGNSAKLPWEGHQSAQWQDWDTSLQFLSAQTEEDHWYWTDEVHNHHYVSRGKVGLRSVVFVEGPPITKRGHDQAYSGQGPMYVREYRRDFFKGLDLIKLRSCILPNAQTPAHIYFLDPQPSMNEPKYRLPNGKINQKKLDAARKHRYDRWNAGTPPHKVKLPDAYMAKVKAHDEAQRQKRSLAHEAWKRFVSGDSATQPVAPKPEPGLWDRFIRWIVE